MRFSPAAISASMSRALSRVGSVRSSFCRPSRGPTSYTSTRSGSPAESRHARAAMFVRIHWTMSCVELPGVKISVTPRVLSLGMSSSGMMPPPKTRDVHRLALS